MVVARIRSLRVSLKVPVQMNGSPLPVDRKIRERCAFQCIVLLHAILMKGGDPPVRSVKKSS